MAQLYSTGHCLIYVGIGSPAPPAPSMSPTAEGAVAATAIAVAAPARGILPIFLGTCEEAPIIELKPYYRPLATGDSGDTADDVMFMGEEAMIFADINWYLESVYATISARPRYGSVRGSTSPRDIGTLMLRSGNTYPLWVVFTGSVRPAMGGASALVGAIGGGALGFVGANLLGTLGLPGSPTSLPSGQVSSPMPAGYRFPNAYLVLDEMPRLGTRARRVSLGWHALKAPARIGSTPGSSSNAPMATRILYDHNMTGLPRPA